MATTAAQRRWRARDPKRSVEVRLSPAAVSRLDGLIRRMGARGRGEAIERLLTADCGIAPDVLLNEAARLARSYLRETGQVETGLRDPSDGTLYIVKAERADPDAR